MNFLIVYTNIVLIKQTETRNNYEFRLKTEYIVHRRVVHYNNVGILNLYKFSFKSMTN